MDMRARNYSVQPAISMLTELFSIYHFHSKLCGDMIWIFNQKFVRPVYHFRPRGQPEKSTLAKLMYLHFLNPVVCAEQREKKPLNKHYLKEKEQNPTVHLTDGELFADTRRYLMQEEPSSLCSDCAEGFTKDLMNPMYSDCLVVTNGYGFSN